MKLALSGNFTPAVLVGVTCASLALAASFNKSAFADEKPIDRVIPRKKTNKVADPARGGVFRDCAKCPQMVVIPAGRFAMGSPPAATAMNNEGPQRRVTVRRFAMGRYEVTFAEWDACVAAGGCTRRPKDEGWGRGRRPAINVSWNDAQQYVHWLRRVTGKRYRLPSEAEWEYAARAGTRTRYWWGDAVGSGNANCRNCGSRWGAKWTAPAGSFRANRFGLYDVHGNVWEWVQDCRHANYRGAPTNGRVWAGGNCRRRVLRGGSWRDFDSNARSAVRLSLEPTGQLNHIGFRVARTLP